MFRISANSVFSVWLLLAFVLPSCALADTTERPRVGLVLAGGGARGLAHIGVIKYLEENNIRIDAIAGTSMGSIVGGLYASGMNAAQLEEVVRKMDWAAAFNDSTSRDELSFREKQESFDYLIKAKFRYSDGQFRLPSGIVEGQNLNLILHELVHHVSDVSDFDKLSIPYRAVAADIVTGEPVVLDHGDLARAMRASMSIPAVFTPIELNGKLLVDGGIAKNIPVDVVQAMGVDHLIVVDIGTPLSSRDSLGNVFSLVNQLTTILTRRNSEQQLALMNSGDVLIQPDLEAIGVTTLSFDKADEAMSAGYSAAAAAADQLAIMASPPSDIEIALNPVGDEYPQPVIDEIQIWTDGNIPEVLLRHMVNQKTGEPLDMKQLNKDIAEIYGLGAFSLVDYTIDDDSVTGMSSLVVRAKANPLGNSYLKLGLSWNEDTHGESAFSLAGSWRQKGLNKLGGEWYLRGQIGGNSAFLTEFYQPLEQRERLYVTVDYEYRDRKLNLAEDRDIVARLQVRDHRVRVAPGYNLGNVATVRVGGYAGTAHSDVEIGPPALSSSRTKEVGWFGEVIYDTLDKAHFPRSGSKAGVNYSVGESSWGSDNNFEALSFAGFTVTSVGDNTFAALLDWSDQDIRDEGNSALPSRIYSLGGFLKLSGYTSDSLAGSYLGLGEILYWRRLDRKSLLPVDMPIYLGGSLEAGNVWQDRDEAAFNDVIYAGSIWLGVDTPLGPLYLGAGMAENNQRALYLTLGQVF